MFKLDIEKIDFNQQLSCGDFGAVYSYKSSKNDHNGDKWIVKYICTHDPERIIQVIQEIVTGSRYNHANLLPLKSYFMNFDQQNKWNIYLKFPRMKMSLEEYQHDREEKKHPFTQDELIKLFYGITSGVEHLHNRKIAHRNIKLPNILIDNENKVKLTDFGIATDVNANASIDVWRHPGLMIYMAPEVEPDVTLPNKQLYKADIWSIGIVMAALCLGPKFQSLIKENISKLEKRDLIIEEFTKLKYIHDETFFALIQSLLEIDPEKRPTIQQVSEVLEQLHQELSIAENFRDQTSIKKAFHALSEDMDDVETNRTFGTLTTQEPRLPREKFYLARETKFMSFDYERIDFMNMIGRDAFSDIFSYNEVGYNGEEWIVKYSETYKENKVMLALSNIIVGSKCNHHNIFPLKAFYIEANDNRKWHICAKFPRMKTDLKELCDSREKSNPFHQTEIVKYFYGIILGLEHLHDREIAHRDVKPANILLDKDNVVKIAGFDVAVNIDGEDSQYVKSSAGTAIYMAPEIKATDKLKNRELYKADMWSVGVTMARLCLRLAFDSKKIINMSGKEREQFFQEKLSGKEVITAYTKDLADLIKSLIQENANARPTVQQVRRILEDKFSDILGDEIQQDGYNYQIEPEKAEEPKPANQIVQEKKEVKVESQVEEKKNEEPKPVNQVVQASTEKKEDKVESQIKEKKVEESQSSHQSGSTSIEKRDEKAEVEEMKALKKYLDGLFKKKFKFRVDPLKFIIEEPDQDISNGHLIELLTKIKEFKDGETYQNLKGLALRLTYCKTDLSRAINQVVTQICQDCQDLTLLELNFWESELSVSDALLKHISQQLSKNQTNLKELALNFSGCKKLTPIGINNINIEIIPKLTQLKIFQLKLSECTNVTHESIREIFIKIGRNLPDIQTLNLYLEGCDGIKDDTLADLKAQFPKLHSLNNLLVSVSNCKNITNEAIQGLCKSIKQNLEHLNSLHLAFYGLDVSNETKNLIDASMRDLLKGGQKPQIDY